MKGIEGDIGKVEKKAETTMSGWCFGLRVQSLRFRVQFVLGQS